MEIKILHNGIEIETIQLDPSKEYFIGRDDQCEIILLDPKISRKHARIWCEESGDWQIELLSKTGVITVNGEEQSLQTLNHHDQIQVYAYSLVLIEEEAAFNEEAFTHAGDFEEEDAEPEQTNSEPSPEESIHLEEEEDETTAGANQKVENYLRLSYPDQSEDYLKIEGNHWVLGRSDSSDIQIKDVKASRKHIVIRSDGKSFFVKDLGSSNGTSLNQLALKPNQETNLKSGDTIEVGSTKIHFEQRNPIFDEQLARLPVQVHQHAVMQTQDGQLAPISNMPMVANERAGEMGFVMPEQMEGSKKKGKKPLFYGLISILILVAVLGSMDDKQGVKQQASTVQEQKTPYQQLSEEQQNFVNIAFAAAHRFFTLEQWDLAIAEIEKINRYLPEGYADPKQPQILSTKEMMSIAESAAATLRDQEMLEAQKKQKEAFDQKLQEVLLSCQAKAAQMSEAEANACLSFVFTNRPGDKQAEAILESIRQRELAKQQRAVAEANRQSLIQKGESLYYAAKSLHDKGEILDAIDAYNKHIQSNYEDPNRFKVKSKNNMTALKKGISAEVERLRRKMQNHFEAEGQLKECIETADEILKIDPDNLDAQDKRAMAIQQLNSELREDYQDSIFKEAHGEIGEAKKIWKRIIIRDIKDGEYYKKATIKMKKHGGAL